MERIRLSEGFVLIEETKDAYGASHGALLGHGEQMYSNTVPEVFIC